MKSDRFKDRLFAAMEGGSSYSLAKKSGMAESLIRKYLAGDSLPGMDKLVLLADLLGVKLEWLATGKGPKRCGEYPVGEPLGNYRVAERGGLADDQYVFLPWYEVHRATGGATSTGFGQALDALAFKRTWIQSELRVSPDNLSLFVVQGDSMAPALHQGDIVLADRSAALRDGIFLVRMGSSVQVKRLQCMIDGTVKIKSDNQAYEEEYFSPDQVERLDIEFIGRIIWAGKRM